MKTKLLLSELGGRCLLSVFFLILTLASVNTWAQGTNAGSEARPGKAPVASGPEPFAPGDPILFFEDFVLGDGVYDDALANLGLAGDVTFTSDRFAFADLLDDQDWGCVIAMNQNESNVSAYAAALTAYVSGGGSAIYADWYINSSGEAALYNAFEVAGSGTTNQQPIATDGNPLWAGLPAAVGLFSPGWGIYSIGLTAVGGGVGTGTFPNGDAAAMIGNGGATLFVGNLSDTYSVQAEGVQFAENAINETCFPRDPGVIKELISGPLDQNGDIALAVEVGQQPPPVMYDFTIDYYNPGGPDVLILDTVPAEWDTIADVVNALNCSLAGANKKNNGKSATKIDCEYSGDGAVTAFWNTARCHTKGNTKCRPTSCGALYLNNGAEVFEVDEFGDPLSDEPIFTSNNLCLVAVEDGDEPDDPTPDGIDLTGEGDEDGDGFLDWDEACFWGNDPCDFTPDSDEDGVPDPNDNCVDTPNSDQSDVDEDGLGDVCDPCPNDPDQSCICEEAFDCDAGNLNECQAGGVCACFPNVNGPNVCVDATTSCSGLTACPVGDECGPNQACLPDTCCGIQVCVNTNECSGNAPVNYSSDQGPTIGMQ